MIRRDVLKLGGAATIGLALPSSYASAQAKSHPPCVVVDPRFTASLTLADVALTAGALVLHSNGDLASLWHGDLRGAPPGGLLGLTGYADMVMAAGIAAENRRLFRFCMSHQGARGEPDHRLSIGSPTQIAVLDAAGGQWPLALWSMMATGSSNPTDSLRYKLKVRARSGTLWSWAIA